MGLPVQWTIPFVHVQVSGAQFTLTKCSWPRAYQPCPAPSMKALGSGVDCCARTLKKKHRQPIAVARKRWARSAFIIVQDRGFFSLSKTTCHVLKKMSVTDA